MNNTEISKTSSTITLQPVMKTPPYQPFEKFLWTDTIPGVGLALFCCCQLLAPSSVDTPYVGYYNNAHTSKTCLHTLMHAHGIGFQLLQLRTAR